MDVSSISLLISGARGPLLLGNGARGATSSLDHRVGEEGALSEYSLQILGVDLIYDL